MISDVDYNAAYYDFWVGGIVKCLPVYPTGKWKIESGPYYKDKMFIQHKGLIFKRWLSEDIISFRPKVTSTVFSCG